MSKNLTSTLCSIMVMAFIFTGLLTVKSLVDFTMSGPTIQKEITDNFFDYGIYAVARLQYLRQLI